MSNRYLSKLATKVLQAFEGTFANSEQDANLVTVGNPVRNAITGVVEPIVRYDINDQSPLKLLAISGLGGSLVIASALVTYCKRLI